MEIQQHIDAIKAKHEKLRAENPEISEIQYSIRDIPYEKWEAFRSQLKQKATNINNDLMFVVGGWDLDMGSGLVIFFYSERVEIKTTIEVIKKVA